MGRFPQFPRYVFAQGAGTTGGAVAPTHGIRNTNGAGGASYRILRAPIYLASVNDPPTPDDQVEFFWARSTEAIVAGAVVQVNRTRPTNPAPELDVQTNPNAPAAALEFFHVGAAVQTFGAPAVALDVEMPAQESLSELDDLVIGPGQVAWLIAFAAVAGTNWGLQLSCVLERIP